MFSNFHPPAKPPSDIEEALTDARALLKAAGIEGACVEIARRPSTEGQLKGAALGCVIPVTALETLLYRAAVDAGAEHGVPVQRTVLGLDQAGENRLQINLCVEAKLFGGVIKVAVAGFMETRGGTHLHFTQMKMEGGGGMLAGVAGAMIRPKLVQLESTPLDLARLAGVPLQVSSLACDGTSLTFCLNFE